MSLNSVKITENIKCHKELDLNKVDLTGVFSFVSIAGGALVEWLEGKILPGLEFLHK